ncbi:MAG TPA: SRPBCC domain-containing protein [Pyrinomonadaceae bacterium]|nr:SRPBCC domain-containing protein [Pyrinomonadaceae bacterium]
MELKFQVQTKIQKPIAEVFDAVYNPKKLSGYFTTGGASAPLDEGTTVEWTFADTPGAEIGPLPVEVKEVKKNELIAFAWKASSGDYNTRVEMKFEETGPAETLVKISESGWKEDEEGLRDSYGNCMGWSHMVSALKAFTEYGINLREGAYRDLYKPEDFESKSTNKKTAAEGA